MTGSQTRRRSDTNFNDQVAWRISFHYSVHDSYSYIVILILILYFYGIKCCGKTGGGLKNNRPTTWNALLKNDDGIATHTGKVGNRVSNLTPWKHNARKQLKPFHLEERIRKYSLYDENLPLPLSTVTYRRKKYA